MTKTISILGSTGSIGTQTLEVLDTSPEDYELYAMGAHSSVELLVSQAKKYHPKVVVLGDEKKLEQLQAGLRKAGLKSVLNKTPSKNEIQILTGPHALAEASGAADIVVNAVVGFAGLAVTLETLKSGKRLALANKESLIAAGPLVQKVRQTPGAELSPVDSEHCAIHQCMTEGRENGTGAPNNKTVSKIILTASGGPFRGFTREDLKSVTLEQALNHPTWDMGPKITVDSSTLMNKGLEVIEANELFGTGFDRIEVVVHPQSVIHSMVEFNDGAVLAQMSMPDMRLCIGYALSFPDRLNHPFGSIDWASLRELTFDQPDVEAFPCLALAYEAGRRGDTAPAVLNAANEVANEAFLQGKIKWTQIPQVIETALESGGYSSACDLDTILEEDRLARKTASAEVENLMGAVV